MAAGAMSIDDYAQGVLVGDRTLLARAITLVESKRSADRARAAELLDRVLPHTGKAHRVGISGVPGVGKSTFIEALGSQLTAAGKKVAVLAVDPTSSLSGGAILGDKTRMDRLSNDANAFVRPSPSGGKLGGVARATRESMLLCEAAGYDVVLIETVGTGQSETMVADMVDFFLVLMLPGAGDELQGIKKGILEIADMIAINKADGENIKKANQALREYRAALHIMASDDEWKVPVEACSATEDTGLGDVWQKVEEHARLMAENGKAAERRSKQDVKWLWSQLEDRLQDSFRNHPAIKEILSGVEKDVQSGKITASGGAEQLLKVYLGEG